VNAAVLASAILLYTIKVRGVHGPEATGHSVVLANERERAYSATYLEFAERPRGAIVLVE